MGEFCAAASAMAPRMIAAISGSFPSEGGTYVVVGRLVGADVGAAVVVVVGGSVVVVLIVVVVVVVVDVVDVVVGAATVVVVDNEVVVDVRSEGRVVGSSSVQPGTRTITHATATAAAMSQLVRPGRRAVTPQGSAASIAASYLCVRLNRGTWRACGAPPGGTGG